MRKLAKGPSGVAVRVHIHKACLLAAILWTCACAQDDRRLVTELKLKPNQWLLQSVDGSNLAITDSVRLKFDWTEGEPLTLNGLPVKHGWVADPPHPNARLRVLYGEAPMVQKLLQDGSDWNRATAAFEDSVSSLMRSNLSTYRALLASGLTADAAMHSVIESTCANPIVCGAWAREIPQERTSMDSVRMIQVKIAGVPAEFTTELTPESRIPSTVRDWKKVAATKDQAHRAVEKLRAALDSIPSPLAIVQDEAGVRIETGQLALELVAEGRAKEVGR